jgi:shikimate kinase
MQSVLSKKNNIVLIGFMACGKSTIALELARKLGKRFVDLDASIAKNVGSSIPTIFQKEGESAFRRYERYAIHNVAKHHDQIIATGGGVVLNMRNIELLKEVAFIVYLSAKPEVILDRLNKSKTIRPLLPPRSTLSDISELMAIRQPYYQAAADITVEVETKNIKELAREILKEINEYESHYNPK